MEPEVRDYLTQSENLLVEAALVTACDATAYYIHNALEEIQAALIAQGTDVKENAA